MKNVFDIHFVELQNHENQNTIDFIVAVHEQQDIIKIKIDIENQLSERLKTWTMIDLCVIVSD